MTVHKTGKTIVLFRKNDLDAFLAAFVYWWLFGKDSIRPTDTLIHDGPMINFKAVDVFEGISPNGNVDPDLHEAHVTWSPKVANYLGSGDTVLSIGINLPSTPAASNFFSYENTATFGHLYNETIGYWAGKDMPEGCEYFFDQNKHLTELMFSSLIEAGHLSVDDKSFRTLNQFFQFFDGKNPGLQFNADVCDRVATYFPRLRVEDFPKLGKFIEDPIGFMEEQRKISPEQAVRDYVSTNRHAAEAIATYAEAYFNQTGIRLKLINSEALDSTKPLTSQHIDEAVFVYRMVKEGVRGLYYSSQKHNEDALAVFPKERPCIGDHRRAEWLISLPDFYSLHYAAPQAVDINDAK